jgi:hypothetical protein
VLPAICRNNNVQHPILRINNHFFNVASSSTTINRAASPQQPPGVRAATLHLQRIRRIPAHKLLASTRHKTCASY